MDTLVSLVYRSRASWPLDAAELDALLLDARANNQMADVTGALLYGEQSFLQYLEGPEVGIARVYARINRARQHHQLEVLQWGPLPTRHFQRWHMGFASTPQSMLQRLSHQHWERALPWLQDERGPSTGLSELIAFWNQQAETGS